MKLQDEIMEMALKFQREEIAEEEEPQIQFGGGILRQD
jgi:hypothetical protein